jgi:hypothetical protein
MRKMSLRLATALLLSTILFIPSDLLAWGVEGHKAVAIIAANRLKGTSTEKRISALLGNLTLADIAVCPDEVRALEQPHHNPLSPACASIFPKNPPKGTANWHFVDTPVKTDDPNFNPSPADVTAACKSDCVLVQIDRFLKVLASAKPNDTAAQKLAERQALSFVVHFIGDVHQPLHAADRNNDRGGNNEHVKFFNSESVLHSIWDTAIVSKIDGNETQLASDLKPEITNAAQEPASKPMDWALQSYRFARDVAYKNIPEASKNNPNADVATLTEDYQKSAEPVVREQLARAGVRLADALAANLK